MRVVGGNRGERGDAVFRGSDLKAPRRNQFAPRLSGRGIVFNNQYSLRTHFLLTTQDQSFQIVTQDQGEASVKCAPLLPKRAVSGRAFTSQKWAAYGVTRSRKRVARKRMKNLQSTRLSHEKTPTIPETSHNGMNLAVARASLFHRKDDRVRFTNSS